MAQNESIGGIQVDIVGDYSTLSQSIDGAAQIAQQGGEKIASALNEGAAGADALSGAVTAAAVGMQSFEAQIQALVDSGSTLAEALNQVQAGAEASGTAAAEAAEQLNLFDEAIQVPYADAAGQLNLFTTELEPLAGAAEKAAESEEKLNEATHEAGGGAHDASVNVGELTTKLLEVAGITLSIEAIKAFAEACIEAAADEERMGEGIAFMRGNIADAGAEVEHLRDLAQQLAQPFEEVGRAAQNFAFLGFTADQTAAALNVADDAAKASGRSFESLAGSLSNIALSGMAMPRTLRQLGISIGDLAEVMGVSVDKVQVAFKGMNESARLDALMAAMAATAGASQAMAGDTESSLTRFANAWKAVKGDVGAFVTPFVEDMMPAVAAALRVVGTVAIEVVGGIQAVVHVLAGLVATALDAIQGLGKAVLLSMTGNIGEAAVVASAAIAAVTQDSKNIWMQYQSDAAATTASVKKLWADQTAAAEESAGGQSAAWSAAAKAAAAAALAAADAAKEAKKELQELDTFAKSAENLFNSIPDTYDEYVKRLADGGATAQAMLRQTESELTKAATLMESMHGAPLAAMKEWVDGLKEAQTTLKTWADSDAWSASAQKITQFVDKFPAATHAMDEWALDMVNDALRVARDVPDALNKIKPEELIGKFLAAQNQLDDAVQKTSEHFEKSMLKMAEDAAKPLPILATLTERLSSVDTTLQAVAARQGKAWDVSPIAAYYQMLGGMNAEGFKSLQQLDSQIQGQKDLLASMVAMNQPLGERLALQEKITQEIITEDQITGRSATDQIVALNNIKLAQQALIDHTRLMGDMYVGVENDILRGWDELGKTIADNIIEEKDWGQAFLKVGEDIGKMILETLVGTAFKALKDSLLENLGLIKDIGKSTVDLGGIFSKTFGGTGGGGGGGNVAGAAGSGGGILSNLSGFASMLTSILTLVNGIIQDFQLAHLSKVMGQVEENTRYLYLKAAKYFETDSWEQQKGVVTTLGMIDDRLGDIWQTLQDPTKGAGAGVSALNSTLVQNSLNEIVMMTGMYNEISTSNSTLSAISGQLNDANNWLNHIFLAFGSIPKLAGGTPYVPTDMLAMIHQGEAVIPASGFGSLPSIPGASTMLAGAGPQSLGGGGTAGLTQNVSIVVKEASNPRQTAREIASTLKSISGKFGPNGQ